MVGGGGGLAKGGVSWSLDIWRSKRRVVSVGASVYGIVCVRWVLCGWLVREGVKEGGRPRKGQAANPLDSRWKNFLLERELVSRIEAAVGTRFWFSSKQKMDVW